MKPVTTDPVERSHERSKGLLDRFNEEARKYIDKLRRQGEENGPGIEEEFEPTPRGERDR